MSKTSITFEDFSGKQVSLEDLIAHTVEDLFANAPLIDEELRSMGKRMNLLQQRQTKLRELKHEIHGLKDLERELQLLQNKIETQKQDIHATYEEVAAIEASILLAGKSSNKCASVL